MIRNLLSNALKYTRSGKVLLGCRRREGNAEHRDLGHRHRHPEDELKAIFEEYHQVDNAARERSRGLGWACPSCSVLASCWAIRVSVRSRAGQGLGLLRSRSRCLRSGAARLADRSS